MSKSKHNPQTRSPEQVFALREDVEKLTREYIMAILESKHSAESEATKLLSILDSIGDGLIVFDGNMKLVLINQAAVQIVG